MLLYAYAIGVRSSRQIERRCREDLAFRVLAGNQLPDHVTIARFRIRHQQALAGFLVESLKLCATAGLVRLGVVALDGTKLAANVTDPDSRLVHARNGWVQGYNAQAVTTCEQVIVAAGLVRRTAAGVQAVALPGGSPPEGP